jgi:chorismate dehydratase
MPAKLRVGAVNYLNSKPLIERLAEFAPEIDLSLDLPSRLADRMAAGELDVGLIPVIEYFRGEGQVGVTQLGCRTAFPGRPDGLESPSYDGKTVQLRKSHQGYTYIPGIAIASRGPVLSVTLFSRVPWPEIRSVALDEGSRTSSALAQILLRKRYGANAEVRPLPIDAPAEDAEADAVLLIGDRAMRACLPGFRHAYDLGEEWSRWTDLPMVYALWAVRGGVELGATEAAFHRAKEYGLARTGAIAEREAPSLGLDAGYCRRYLDTLIRYDLGPRELAGMRKYRELAAELGLAPKCVLAGGAA